MVMQYLKTAKDAVISEAFHGLDDLEYAWCLSPWGQAALTEEEQ